MSIISGPILKVSDIHIIAGIVYPAKIVQRKDKTTGQLRRFKVVDGSPPMQLTIYNNFIEKDVSHERAVMILPFPQMQRRKRFKILDLSNYIEIFSDFGQFFKPIPLKTTGISWDTWEDENDLFQVSAAKYEPTVVASFEELERNRQKFSISHETMKEISLYYRKQYGFIICEIPATAKYAPIAYVHELMPNEKLFIPTRHIHERATAYGRSQTFDDESVVGDLMRESFHISDKYIAHKIKKSTINSINNAKNDWNHTIYIFNKPRIVENSIFTQKQITLETGKQTMVDKYKKFIKVANTPREITFNGISFLSRIIVHDTYKNNHDFII